MILIEGPDGAGKTTLLRRLSRDLGIPQHARAVTDVSGPDGRDLWGWACQDIMTWDVQPVSVYDRHPTISEYIYGPIVRGCLPPGFLHPSSRGILSRVHKQALVVFALPDFETVKANVAQEDQMSGVVSNIEAIYWSYRAVRANWPGWAVDYDYRVKSGSHSYDSVVRAARVHLATWKA